MLTGAWKNARLLWVGEQKKAQLENGKSSRASQWASKNPDQSFGSGPLGRHHLRLKKETKGAPKRGDVEELLLKRKVRLKILNYNFKSQVLFLF